MLDKAKQIIDKYNDLSKDIASPEIINNHTKLAQLAKEQSDLETLYKKCKEYCQKKQEYEQNTILINEEEEEIVLMAKEENDLISSEIESLESELKVLFIPRDPNDRYVVFSERLFLRTILSSIGVPSSR